MQTHVEELILKKLDTMEKQLGRLDTMEKQLGRLEAMEQKLDEVVDTVGEMKVELSETHVDVSALKTDVARLDMHVFSIEQMLPTLATKEEMRNSFVEVTDTLENHTGMLKALQEDRYAEKVRVDRIENGLNEVRHLQGLQKV